MTPRSLRIATLLVSIAMLAACGGGGGRDPSPTPVPLVFVHPGVSYLQADLDRVRSKVAAGTEPYASAFDAYRSLGYSSPLNTGQGPRAVVNFDGSEFVMRNDANVCHNHAVMWIVTGDVRYRDNAIRLMNAWTDTLVSFPAADHLTAGTVAYDFCNAGEILRATAADAGPADAITRFQTMLVTLLYPALVTPGTPTNLGWLEAAGHGGLQMKGLMALGIFCDRRDIFDFAIRSYKHDGGASYGVTEYIDACGQCYEAQRDQGHSRGNVMTLAQIAMMAWNQGVDLFSYANNRLLLGSETVCKTNLGFDVTPTAWLALDGTWHGAVVSTLSYPAVPLPDIVTRIYHGVKGLESPYTQMAADYLHPDTAGAGGASSLLFRIDDSGKRPVVPLIGEPLPTEVRLYDDSWSGSYVIRLTPGAYTAADLRARATAFPNFSDDSISSIRIPPLWSVIAYTGDNFTGTSITLTYDATAPMANMVLPTGWNDVISSVVVTGGGTYAPSNGTYVTTNRNSGKALRATGTEDDGGGAIDQAPFVGSLSQFWRVEELGYGVRQYSITNLRTRRALEAPSSADGAAIVFGDFVGSANLAIGAAASANDETALGEGAAKAFDGNAGTKWYAPTGAPCWVRCDLAGGAVAVDRYEVTSADDVPERDPAAWNFQGSNDGTTWVTVDSRSGQSFPNRFQMKSFPCVNTTPFSRYRLSVTSSKTSGYGVQLSELALYASSNGNSRQRWKIDPVAGTAYGSWLTVTNTATGMALEVEGASLADGARMVQRAPAARTSQHWSLRVPPILGAAPGIVRGVASDGRIDLTWSPAEGATTYTLKRSLAKSSGYTTLATTPGTTWPDTAVVDGTLYYYVVSATGVLGESVDTAPVPFVPGIVPNGGFEAPEVGIGTRTNVYNVPATSWTFGGWALDAASVWHGAGIAANGSDLTSGNPVAPQGAQVAFLEGNGYVRGPVGPLEIGTTYTLHFLAAQRQNVVQAGQTFDVWMDYTRIGSYTPPASATTYEPYDVTFTAAATNPTLLFYATNTRGGDNTIFLDDVRIAH